MLLITIPRFNLWLPKYNPKYVYQLFHRYKCLIFLPWKKGLRIDATPEPACLFCIRDRILYMIFVWDMIMITGSSMFIAWVYSIHGKIPIILHQAWTLISAMKSNLKLTPLVARCIVCYNLLVAGSVYILRCFVSNRRLQSTVISL